MEQIFLSLGSNLGDRLENLRRALASIREFAAILALSDAYETEPVGYTDQPWFVNAVVALRVVNLAGGVEPMDRTGSEDAAADENLPHRLLERLMSIERLIGRQRGVAGAIPKGPRVIDIDILMFGDRVIDSAELTIPHPAMHLRRFVLEPLVQIAPQLEHPILRQSALQLLRALPVEGPLVRRLGALDLAEE
jgi:2-amino-4-hydroxy-6-hydroxymethyldihydropteridine diphosphokinase